MSVADGIFNALALLIVGGTVAGVTIVVAIVILIRTVAKDARNRPPDRLD